MATLKLNLNFFKFFSFIATLSYGAGVMEAKFRVVNMRVESWAHILSVLGLEHTEIRV